MRVAYGSDFHLEFYSEAKAKSIINSWKFEKDTNVIIIAGDFAVGANNVLKYLLYIASVHGIFVIYVPGNHEYYGSSFEKENEIFKLHSRSDEWAILTDGEHICIGPYVFIGAMGNIDGSYEEIFKWKHGSLNDFHEIKDFEKMHKIMGEREYRNIHDLLSAHDTKKTVVITHTMPSPKCVSKEYTGSYMNACFCNDWRYLINEFSPSCWICGHTHSRNKVFIDNSFVLMNPFGYPSENSNWNWEYIIL